MLQIYCHYPCTIDFFAYLRFFGLKFFFVLFGHLVSYLFGPLDSVYQTCSNLTIQITNLALWLITIWRFVFDTQTRRRITAIMLKSFHGLTILAPSGVRKSKDPSPGNDAISNVLFKIPVPRLTLVNRMEILSPNRQFEGRSKWERRQPPIESVCPLRTETPANVAIILFVKSVALKIALAL